jgi:hypothetical protein
VFFFVIKMLEVNHIRFLFAFHNRRFIVDVGMHGFLVEVHLLNTLFTSVIHILYR